MKYYVNKNGNDANAGTATQPFLTISKAAELAGPGDEIEVGAGIYREWVNPQRGGTPEARITYQAAPGAEVIITGAEVVTDWMPEGDIWKLEIPNGLFVHRNPFEEEIFGDWYFDNGKGYHLGEVYLNGKSMYESLTLDGVKHPQETENSHDKPGSLYTWHAQVDDQKTTIWANFHGADPRQELVEINVRPFVFWPSETGKGFITVKGFTLKQAAPQWAPPTSLQEGLIGPHWSKGWIIENCLISDSKNVGISLGKELGTGDNEATRTGYKGGTQREREVIFRALHNANWTKDAVGSHIVRNNIIQDCEQAGIVGHLGAAFSTIENNHIRRTHYKRQWHGAEVGGIKLHAALDTLISGNIIHDAYRGIWLDWQAQGTRITKNVLYHNVSEDMMIEVCHGPYLVDNNIFLSDWALKDMSTGGAFVHNFIQGKIAASTEHNRYTPYHFPHDTAVYGVANIRGGDDRFYNNIFYRRPIAAETFGRSNFWNGATLMDGVPSNATFMQTPVGISQYDDFPGADHVVAQKDGPFDELAKLPIYAGGNLYLGNAQPHAKELDATIVPGLDAIAINVTDPEQGVIEVTITDPATLNTGKSKVITTDKLGVSYQAEMAYEQPDGSPYVLDTDFHGQLRQQVTPGPFEVAQAGTITIVAPNPSN